ncbi:hypothetical protein [Cryobacterium sp. Y82]|uniref:hypothetical protein n=1 Tax=Cryobacterium sp. Y82 TaxID=2045017 RepID=UPI000CE364DA|nr:hypothetical protein [Cryobacterium sp. Y82]
MNTKHTNIRKITALGITGAAASALMIGGFVAPAQAFAGDSSSTTTSTDSSSEQNRLDVIGDLFNLSGNDSTGNGVLGNDTSVGGVGNGAILGGGVVNGPLVDDSLNSDIGDVASGNEVGNDASVGSGNDVVAPIEAPVTAPVDAPVDAGNGTDVGTNVGGVDVDDIDGSVDSIVNDVLGDLGLGLGR